MLKKPERNTHYNDWEREQKGNGYLSASSKVLVNKVPKLLTSKWRHTKNFIRTAKISFRLMSSGLNIIPADIELGEEETILGKHERQKADYSEMNVG